jgi:hypothetical protein
MSRDYTRIHSVAARALSALTANFRGIGAPSLPEEGSYLAYNQSQQNTLR